MSILQYLVLASVSALILLFIAAPSPRVRRPRRRVPVVNALNLEEITMEQAIVGTPKPFSITPTAGGEPVDLAKFPSALTDITYAVNDPAIASVNVTTADNLNCEVTFAVEGSVVLTVAGKNVNGDPVQDSIEITGSVPVPVVDALNLKAA